MITARDMAVAYAPPRLTAAPLPAGIARPFRERLLLVVLYVTVFASSIAFIEPSPHDGLMGVLAVACIIAGVHFERRIVLFVMLLLIFNVSGLIALLNVVGHEKTVQYTATSIYLAVAGIIFACLFAENTMPRLAAMRSAYVLTAVLVALAGTLGYFNAFPGAQFLFASVGRAMGAFKDPNVFGPFLIWPTLIVMERMFVRRISFSDLFVVVILLLGLLLSFSRGAWFHFGVSCAVMIALAFLTAPNMRVRVRVFGFTVIGFAAIAAFIAIALSFSSIDTMFKERFQLVQSYDVGQGGRFELQELAVSEVLRNPFGMGPFEFSRVYGLQQHNVYLQAFLVYGWLGGVSYILMLLTTFFVALRSVFVATPWQPYVITALAAFTGEVLEGAVIDSDHWRHFYLLLGMIWGLYAATAKYLNRQPAPGGSYVYVRA